MSWLNWLTLVSRMKTASSAAAVSATIRKARVSLRVSESLSGLNRLMALGVAFRFDQAIAHPKHRLNVLRLVGVELDAGAQVADVHVEGALQPRVAYLRELVGQLL